MCRPAAFAALALLGACQDREPVSLTAAQALSAPTRVGAAPMCAVSPSGVRAVAWVSAPDGGTDGRLYLSTGGDPVEVRDTLGPIEAHGESPPKIVYAP